MFSKKIMVLGTALMLAAPMAGAQTLMVTSDSDLTLRVGPGKKFDALGDVPKNAAIAVEGCVAAGDWCAVSYNGISGWVQAKELRVNTDGTSYVFTDRPETVSVTTIEYDKDKVNRNAATAGLAGAAAGAAIAGPPGAVVGAVVGGLGGAAATEPDEKVTTYVTSNPVAPVAVPGGVVVGSTIPSSVVLTPVPESQYGYIYVDGRPVLVDTSTRTVVRVID